MNKEIDESPYCDVCGTCGYIDCCGIRNFIDKHIKGKTNCKNEDGIIIDLINLCEYRDKVFEERDKYKEVLDKIKEYVSGENANYLIENAESHLSAKAIDEILGDILELLEEIE